MKVLFLIIPTTGILAAIWLLNVSVSGLLSWAFVGAAGLMAAIKSSRNDSRWVSVIIWSPEQMGIVVNALAYNGVLIPSIAIAQVAWAETGSLALGVSLAFLTPILLLKHIYFILMLSTPETR